MRHPRLARMWARVPRRWRILGITLAVIPALAYAVAYLVDEPLRRMVERRMNEQLKGYQVRIGALDLHPLGLGLELEDVIVIQEATPGPPLAALPELALSVHWRDLLHGALVADCVLHRPVVTVSLKQAEQEARDGVPVSERGWQDAVQAAYPLEINDFRIVDAELTYSDGGPFEPIRLHPLDFEASNIRNVRSAAGTYPSTIHLRAVLLETSTLDVKGHADFLAQPHAAVKTDFDLRDLRLSYLQPALHHFNLTLRRGSASAEGAVEYAATSLQAYGGFDVAGGTFSFFSELRVRDGEVRGYVKPIFKDMDVYAAAQDADKPVFRKMYEGIVGGVANLFENRSENQVATETEVSGTIGDDVSTSTWQIVLGLVRNAFFQAILPGLDRELRTRRSG